MFNKKIKVFLISDILISSSGVGIQSRYIVEGLMKSGKFIVRQFGGAIEHGSYQSVRFSEYGEDLIVIPVDGFGTKDQIRSFIRTEKPDIMILFTDPRFFVFFFEMANEVNPHLPIVYYNIWDHPPSPFFNAPYYRSCDYLACISKLTHRLISEVAPEIENCYLPHAVDDKIFRTLPEKDVMEFKKAVIPEGEDKFVFFYNSRNARRKMTSSIILWFDKFLQKVGKDKAILLMHTNPRDDAGSNLEEVIKYLGLVHGEVKFSQENIAPEGLALMYNMSDCTVNISNAEGHGLCATESLSCGTPIIVSMTGGLQDQVTDGQKWFGIGLEPVAKPLVGSQEVPYIFEDYVCEEQVVNAFLKMFEMSSRERREIGLLGQKHVQTNYNFNNFQQKWVELLEYIYDKYGSWPKKNYKSFTLKKF